MAFHSAIGANVLKPRQSTLQTTRLPAPAAGIDARASYAQMPADNCLYSFNMVGGEYGMTLRSGYREWVIDCEVSSGSGSGVRTIMGFDSSATGTSGSKLFAVTEEGIWDVTTEDSTPSRVATFTVTGLGAGHGVFTQYVDGSGDDFMFYADELNGLWVYTATLGTWAAASGMTGVNTALVAYVVVHKQRIWLIEQASSTAWYLPVGAMAGAATEFFFGAKFPHGGTLRGLYNWTVDGGDGVDDYLVAVSGSGDVIPYRGEDPSTADTWSSVGTYFIGAVPNGRRITSSYLGNLYLLSSVGLIAMSDLLRGVDSSVVNIKDSLTYKISAPVRQAMVDAREKYGWEPKFMPEFGLLMILRPHFPTNYPQLQWTQNLTTQSWGEWRDVPAFCIDEWHGKLYFGDDDNRVHVLDGTKDAVLLDDADPDAGGSPVKFSILTSYQDYGAPTQFKIGQFVRPDFHSTVKPSHETKILYDYDIVEFTYSPVASGSSGSVWDTGLWDAAIWGGGVKEGQSELSGEAGMGRMMAIAVRGEASEATRLLSMDVMWTSGGVV